MRRLAAAMLAVSLAGCAANSRMDDARRAFLGNAAEPSRVIAAELALARLSRERGTTAAIRETATEDAIWPSPRWANVRASLRGTPDPLPAIAGEPDLIWSSCDGNYAFATGPATSSVGERTRFATIWQRQNDGRYRWVLRQSLTLEDGHTRPEMIGAEVAQCGERRRGRPENARRGLAWQSAQSADETLAWTSELAADCSRRFVLRARRGGELTEVFSGAATPPASSNATAGCVG